MRVMAELNAVVTAPIVRVELGKIGSIVAPGDEDDLTGLRNTNLKSMTRLPSL